MFLTFTERRRRRRAPPTRYELTLVPVAAQLKVPVGAVITFPSAHWNIRPVQMHATRLVDGGGPIAVDRLGCDGRGKDTAKGDKSKERLHGTFSYVVRVSALKADNNHVASAPMFFFAGIAHDFSNLRPSADNSHMA
jgi:hypothetical protein